jgi:hypothetical protein
LLNQRYSLLVDPAPGKARKQGLYLLRSRRLGCPEPFGFRELRVHSNEILNFVEDRIAAARELSFLSQIKYLAQKEHSFHIAVLLQGAKLVKNA